MASAADYLSPAQLADLSALADGSLDPARREAVEAWIGSSPELFELYKREQAAVTALQKAALERAPARLRLRVQAQTANRPRRARVRAGYGALAAAAVAAALALVLLLPGGTPGSPSVSQAAALALRGPSAPAPAPDSTAPRLKLSSPFQELYFPNWSSTLRWRAIGMRRDRLDGRPAMTVYYQRGGRVVAYTIVGVPALGSPAGVITHVRGYELRILSLTGRTVVTWRRAGHTCVLSAARVPVSALEQLAGWRAPGLSD
jgi:hypothetical protein